jgi:hypothetical protein
MARRSATATAGTFLELLQEQIDFLQNDDYEYTQLLIWTAGTDEPWTFGPEHELDICAEQGQLLARDGPSDDLGNEDVPEYLIRLDAIVGSQLV